MRSFLIFILILTILFTASCASVSDRKNALVEPFKSERALAVLGTENLREIGLKKDDGIALETFIQNHLSIGEQGGFVTKSFNVSNNKDPLTLFLLTKRMDRETSCIPLVLGINLGNGDSFQGEGTVCPKLTKQGVIWKRSV
ncbi:hypothetical protein H6777_00580 [Candidatus Nomurabacteria bacterium]|nr:hypothetical protein [Candidatus Nomurabacteria bacterium]